MGGHMGDALHYHGMGEDRYGHRHPYLHINHEHDSPSSDAQVEVARILVGLAYGKREVS